MPEVTLYLLPDRQMLALLTETVIWSVVDSALAVMFEVFLILQGVPEKTHKV